MAQLNGLVLLKPTSVEKIGTGSTATVNANGSVTFSLCTTLSLNGVFSSEFDNYFVVINATSAGETNVLLRYRSGTDNSETVYTNQSLLVNNTTRTATRSTSQTSMNVLDSNSTSSESSAVAYIYGPYLAAPTACRSITANCRATLANSRLIDYASTHNRSVSYDGFSLVGASFSITGLVTVYGMRD